MSRESANLLRLAFPVVISQVGAMLMGLTDTIVVGRYSSIALAGVAAGNSIFWLAAIVGMGLLNGMDPIIAQAYGAGKREDADRCLGVALQLCVLFTLIVTPILFVCAHYIHLLGSEPEVVSEARPFLQGLTIGLLPLMFFSALQKYWQNFEIVMPFTVIILALNVVNLGADLILVPGLFGLPAFGAQGAAIATFTCRIIALALAVGWGVRLWRKQGIHEISYLWKIARTYDPEMLKRLWKLGLPAASHYFLEVSAFSLTTMLVARLGAQTLATHQIVLNIASFTFMLPMGLSAAIATRVGYHEGAGRHAEAHHAGWLGIGYAFLVMTLSALAFVFLPEPILRIFTQDAEVVTLGLSILIICACFQVFDGVQVASAGALRGLGDTKTAFFSNLLGHYGMGLPVGLSLCFYWHKGLWGLWIGLALGLSVAALINTWVWRKKLRPV